MKKRAQIKILLSLFILLVGPHESSNGQDVARSICTQLQLQSATAAYNIGQFTSIFQSLKPCLPNGFESREERSDAWRLMALSYVAVDSLDAAELSVRSLLRENKRFQPNPAADPLQFVNLVQDLKPRWYSWPYKGGEWYKWAGRGLIVGTAILLPSLLKKDELGPLPGPPTLPNAN